MVRSVGIALLVLLLPLQAVALALGDLVVRSVPGQPLRAHIPLTLNSGESLAELRLALASAEQYAEHDMPRPPMAQGLRLALLDRGEGRARIQLFGEQPWQGEEALLLLTLRWPDGEIERQFKLAAVTPAEGATPIYVEVAKDETLDEIAMRLSKGSNRSYLHMMYALFLANPEAFYRGNMNNLKSKATLRVPSEAELFALSDREVFGGIRQQYEQWQQLRGEKPSASRAAAALAGMSDEQVAGLGLSDNPDALQQKLLQVAAESEAIRKENEALQQRLRALEERMQNVAGQVLEYAEGDLTPPAQPQPEKEQEPQRLEKQPEQDAPPQEEGLTLSGMLGAALLVLLFAFYIWFSAGHPHRWRS